ncbi:MAG: glycoside hydrolase family 5 protein [Chthoniobacteraceae bacterium]
MKFILPCSIVFLAITAVAQNSQPVISSEKSYYPGVNLASAEFGGSGTILGRNFAYPTQAEFTYFQSKGMRVVRIPFKWERLQPALKSDFDSANINELDRCVEQATKLGLVVLLDVHNYGSRSDPADIKKGVYVGMDPEVTGDDFNNLWIRLANHYKDNPLVWFGLMNEPHKHTAVLNASLMQSAVNAIRGTGAKNKILVPGTSFTGAHSWIKSGNADALKNFRDPGNNFVFEVHQYLDKDSSGTHREAVAGSGSSRLVAFTEWARQYHFKGFLGEFGWDNNPADIQAQKEGDDLLTYMDKNRDVWTGYTYWAAGPWWTPSYLYLIEPEGLKTGSPIDKPQISILGKHLN